MATNASAGETLAVLSLNCQKGYHPDASPFLNRVLEGGEYDLIFLQEADSPVLEALGFTVGAYRVLRHRNEPAGDWSHIVILFRSTLVLARSEFYSFDSLTRDKTPRKEYGLALGTFDMGGRRLVAGSIHLNSGSQVLLRTKELRFAKECLLAYNQENLPVFLGGDFNSGLPWEPRRHADIFEPEFVHCTKDSGPTCDSRYVEPTPLLNSCGFLLGKLGVGFSFRSDHFYVDSGTAEAHRIECEVLPDRVSDHSPLRLVAKKK